MSIEKQIFETLLILCPALQRIQEHRKSIVSGFMDLNLDVLHSSGSKKRIALSHYYKRPCGDLIADPDMAIEIDFGKQEATAKTYQDAFLYEEAEEGQSQKRLNTFLLVWLRNLIAQEHKLI